MPVVLVTGAGRGLGLGLATRYLEAGWEVIATVRDACTPLSWRFTPGTRRDCRSKMWIFEDFVSIEACARQLRGRTIDVLLGNAAATSPDAGFGRTDYAAWARLMQVNTFAQLKLAEAFAENVAASARRGAVLRIQQGRSGADSWNDSVPELQISAQPGRVPARAAAPVPRRVRRLRTSWLCEDRMPRASGACSRSRRARTACSC